MIGHVNHHISYAQAWCRFFVFTVVFTHTNSTKWVSPPSSFYSCSNHTSWSLQCILSYSFCLMSVGWVFMKIYVWTCPLHRERWMGGDWLSYRDRTKARWTLLSTSIKNSVVVMMFIKYQRCWAAGSHNHGHLHSFT
jgi:hypothetical protein